MQKCDLKLLVVFIVFCAAIGIRIAGNDNKYVTPDSKHYLRSAKNFNNGKGFITPKIFPFKNQQDEKRLAMWPVGYPLCIAAFTKTTGVPLRWASKIVNLIFFGLTLLLLRKLYGNETWFVALAFFSLTSLEIFSFTWSEGPFIFSMVWFCLILQRWDAIKIKWLQLAICLILSFILRYAGIIYFFQVAGIVAFLAYRKKWSLTIPYIVAGALASVFVIIYLLYNKEHNGLMTGMDRFAREDENTLEYFTMFFRGIINEFLIIRNYYFLGEPITLFLITSILQITLLLFLTKLKGWFKVSIKNNLDKASIILIATGLVYFVGISIIRFVIIFDPLDYRILSPASIPILIGLLGLIANRPTFYSKARIPLFIFFIISLLMNLPKEYLLGLFN